MPQGRVQLGDEAMIVEYALTTTMIGTKRSTAGTFTFSGPVPLGINSVRPSNTMVDGSG